MHFTVGNYEIFLIPGYQGKIRFKFNEDHYSNCMEFRLNKEDIYDLKYAADKLVRLELSNQKELKCD